MGIRNRLRGSGELPGDAVASAGAVDAWAWGECSYVVTLSATGPVRVHYSLTEPAGPAWLRLVPVSERRRRRVLGAALASGALVGAGLVGADGRPVGVEVGAGRATPYGWVHVGGYSRSAWVPLPEDRRVGGVRLADMLTELIPGGTWRELDARRCEAWRAWAQRSGSVPQVRAVMEETLREWRGLAAGLEETRRQAVDQGPWDRRVAGGAGSHGVSGIWHGGGLGGAW
ncbi:hypothetical protein [Actinomadura litoris]|uniref:Uncharacterized protein n=1 Tax=Actinomadura litoris TaxID=2678616 RepID=A0A7K1LDT4_9ACTN|nr:hypothetical protein [Actinomadura litoris]MUN42579.1 hypothetical protein [Actinomadura litoris]